jgi:outer membrane receptor protein involved in Fe transport
MLRLTYAGPLAIAAALAVPPPALVAQGVVSSDSIHQHGDTLTRGRGPVQLQAVTVTAAPSRREDPLSSTRITSAALTRTPAINPYELLRETAGVEVHDQGQGPGFASDASLRGFSSDHSTDLALWIDGVPINEPVNGHAEGYNDWSVLFPQAVQEVDVFRGPTNPVYGNFALAGAVNIRTLDRMSGSLATLSGGMYGRADGTVMTGFDHEHSGGVFGIRGLREDGWRPNAGYDLGQVHARASRDISSSATIDGGVELYAAGWDSPGFLTAGQFAAHDWQRVSDPTDGGFKRRAQERVSLRYILGSSLLWRSTVYGTQGRWQLFLTTPPEGGGEEGTGSQTEEEDHRYGFGATSALTWTYSRGEVTLGTEGRWDRATYENFLTTARTRDEAQEQVRARQLSGAVFLQSLTDLGHHFRLSVGGRYDALDTRSTPFGGTTSSDTKGIVSPKLGALYHLKRVGDLYVNVSRGFRQTDGVISDPSLPFITAWNYEGGVKVDGRRVNASVAVFRMDVSDEQTFDPITLVSTSGGRSRRQGVELIFHSQLTDALHATAEWTFNDAKYRAFVTEDGDTLNGARVFNTARFVGAGSLDWVPPATIWQLHGGLNLVGPYTPFDEPGVELPSYALVNASAGVRLGAALVEIGARNLLDHAYPELRAGGFVVPGQPRSVYGSVRYVF